MFDPFQNHGRHACRAKACGIGGCKRGGQGGLKIRAMIHATALRDKMHLLMLFKAQRELTEKRKAMEEGKRHRTVGLRHV